MKYLLDTHVLLWWLSDDPTLSPEAKKIIADGLNSIFVSPAVVWEIVIKKKLGKLDAPDDLLERIKSNRFFPISITLEHAQEIRELPSLHEDPFDRILIAQARVEALILITRDKMIKKYEVEWIDA